MKSQEILYLLIAMREKCRAYDAAIAAADRVDGYKLDLEIFHAFGKEFYRVTYVVPGMDAGTLENYDLDILAHDLATAFSLLGVG